MRNQNYNHNVFKLVQLCPRLNSGGVERGVVDTAIYMAEQGWDSVVISGGGRLEKDLQAAGVQHIRLPIFSKNPFLFIINLLRIAKVLRQLKPNIIHPYSRVPTWLTKFAKPEHIPWLTSCNGIHSLKPRWLKQPYNRVLVKGDKVIANSQWAKKYLLHNYSINTNMIEVVYRGADISLLASHNIDWKLIQLLKQRWDVPSNKIVIMLPGRVTHWKAQHVFIDALKQIYQHLGDTFVGLLVGDKDFNPSYTHTLQESISISGLANNIKLVGDCKDMASAYAMADLVVNSSIKPEAFGRVVIEAQAIGTLVIATNHGGPAEIIMNEQTGFLVPPNDATALANQILMALKLPQQKKQEIVTAAQKRVQQNFTKTKMCQQMLEIYKNSIR